MVAYAWAATQARKPATSKSAARPLPFGNSRGSLRSRYQLPPQARSSSTAEPVTKVSSPMAGILTRGRIKNAQAYTGMASRTVSSPQALAMAEKSAPAAPVMQMAR